MNLTPKQFFLLDGLGALLSAFSLGVILVQFEHIFGMPREALYVLATIPIFFMLYDLFCYFRIKEQWRPYLRAIALANLGYCVLSIAYVFDHYEELTTLGFIYFLLELVIVIILAIFELKAASRKDSM